MSKGYWGESIKTHTGNEPHPQLLPSTTFSLRSGSGSEVQQDQRISSVVVLRSVFTHVQTQGKEKKIVMRLKKRLTLVALKSKLAAEQAAGAPLRADRPCGASPRERRPWGEHCS